MIPGMHRLALMLLALLVPGIADAQPCLEPTRTRGIVSGLNRLLPGLSEQALIQTDAPINPGNSGGPLVDRCGSVIGINTFISEEAQSIGFSVPINVAKAVLRELREA